MSDFVERPAKKAKYSHEAPQRTIYDIPGDIIFNHIWANLADVYIVIMRRSCKHFDNIYRKYYQIPDKFRTITVGEPETVYIPSVNVSAVSPKQIILLSLIDKFINLHMYYSPQMWAEYAVEHSKLAPRSRRMHNISYAYASPKKMTAQVVLNFVKNCSPFEKFGNTYFPVLFYAGVFDICYFGRYDLYFDPILYLLGSIDIKSMADYYEGLTEKNIINEWQIFTVDNILAFMESPYHARRFLKKLETFKEQNPNNLVANLFETVSEKIFFNKCIKIFCLKISLISYEFLKEFPLDNYLCYREDVVIVIEETFHLELFKVAESLFPSLNAYILSMRQTLKMDNVEEILRRYNIEALDQSIFYRHEAKEFSFLHPFIGIFILIEYLRSAGFPKSIAGIFLKKFDLIKQIRYLLFNLKNSPTSQMSETKKKEEREEKIKILKILTMKREEFLKTPYTELTFDYRKSKKKSSMRFLRYLIFYYCSMIHQNINVDEI